MFPLQAVLFDFDGTLWDPETYIFQVYAEVFDEFGSQLTGDLWATIIGTINFDLWIHLEQATGLPVDRVRLEVTIRRRKAERLAALGSRPGIRSFLDTVDAIGIRRGIVSNSASEWVERYARQCGVADGWQTVQCANGNPRRAKPNPDLYAAALDRMGVEPGAVIAFEDSPSGVRAAKRAGIRCVVVPNAMTAGLDLSEADLRIESFEQIDPHRLLGAFGAAVKS
jgi:HAD superfamily hydrolase (TIGR01509 family)